MTITEIPTQKYVFVGFENHLMCKIDGFQLPVKIGDVFEIKITKKEEHLYRRSGESKIFDVRLKLPDPIAYLNKDIGTYIDKYIMLIYLNEKEFDDQFISMCKYREMRLNKLLD
ncbi:MAG: hypothetical protein SLAVMIC_00346 [uncultured marine phage]|uniref:Uncharacterized protein n=1 Tax=uncultured marine phage TaxID=707152 RepID=A0A8D9CBX8_9VIRU|nr:MAG: hypothetical protein SLAVMIC_00346 [uncultured marine phage]